MREFNIIKRLRDSNTKGSLAVFRLSYSKEHNDLDNLFNFSLWIGMPNHNKKHGSFELFIYKHKGLKIPRLALTDWNYRMYKQRLRDQE